MHRFLGNGLPHVKRLANFTSGLPTSPALGSTSHLIYKNMAVRSVTFRLFSSILDRSSTFAREKVGAISG